MTKPQHSTFTIGELIIWLEAVASCYGDDLALTFDAGRHQETPITNARIRNEEGTRRIVFSGEQTKH